MKRASLVIVFCILVVALAALSQFVASDGVDPDYATTEKTRVILTVMTEQHEISQELEQTGRWRAAHQAMAKIDASNTPEDFQKAFEEFRDKLDAITQLYAEVDAAAGPGTSDAFEAYEPLTDQQEAVLDQYDDRLQAAFETRNKAYTRLVLVAEMHGVEIYRK